MFQMSFAEVAKIITLSYSAQNMIGVASFKSDSWEPQKNSYRIALLFVLSEPYEDFQERPIFKEEICSSSCFSARAPLWNSRLQRIYPNTTASGGEPHAQTIMSSLNQYRVGLVISRYTGLPNKACTWLGELCSCPCLVSRNKLHQTTYKPYSGAL